jgi:hypothetical protein
MHLPFLKLQLKIIRQGYILGTNALSLVDTCLGNVTCASNLFQEIILLFCSDTFNFSPWDSWPNSLQPA